MHSRFFLLERFLIKLDFSFFMTVAIGIKSTLDNTIVLLSDTQITSTVKEGETKSKTHKIINGDFWAFCPVGSFFLQDFERFCRELAYPKRYEKLMYGFGPNPKDYFVKLLESFPQSMSAYRSNPTRMTGLDTLNAIASLTEEDNPTSLLFAVNSPRVELFYVDAFGNLRNYVDKDDDTEEPFLVAGSGREGAIKQLRDDVLKRGLGSSITTGDALQLGISALKKASSDMYTTGLDFTIISKGKIDPKGKNLDEAIEKAIEEVVQQAIQDYSPQEPQEQQ